MIRLDSAMAMGRRILMMAVIGWDAQLICLSGGGVGSRDEGLLTVVRKPGGAAGLRCQVGKSHDSAPSEWVTQIPDGHSHPQQWLSVNWAGPSS